MATKGRATFDLIAGSTTPNDLPDTLVVNGTSMTLVLACDAQGISGTNWSCRGPSGAITLSEAGSGASPVVTTSTPFHALDSAERAVRFPTSGGGKYYAAASSLPDLSDTDDVVVELAGDLRWGGHQGFYFGERADTGGTTAGWAVESQAFAGALSLVIGDGTNASRANTGNLGGAVGDGHMLGFIDASDTGTVALECGGWYINGAVSSNVCNGAPSAVGTPTTAVVATVGATAAGTGQPGVANRGRNTIKVWKCGGCLPGGAANATTVAPIARERTSIAFGVRPTIAAGSAVPTTMTRTVSAFTDTLVAGVRTLYLIGANAPRVAVRSAGTGYLSEPQVTNVWRQTQTFDTTWTQTAVTLAVDSAAAIAPDGTQTAEGVIATAVSASHLVRLDPATTAATHTASVWAKRGASDFVGFYFGTIANGIMFNLATGTVGSRFTSTANVTGAIEDYGNGWFRCSVTFTATAGTQDGSIYLSRADWAANSAFTHVFTGDATTVDTYLWGAQVEAFPTATSYIATTTASVTRTADDLRYDGAGNYLGSPTTMDVAVLCPFLSGSPGGNPELLFIGQNTSNYMAQLLLSSGNPRWLGLVGAATQYDLSSSPSLHDGISHTLRTTAATNNITAYRDGVSIGTDAVATLPPTASALIAVVGAVAGQKSFCLPSRVRIWPRLVTPAEIP